jgi:hypothetical protein
MKMYRVEAYVRLLTTIDVDAADHAEAAEMVRDSLLYMELPELGHDFDMSVDIFNTEEVDE